MLSLKAALEEATASIGRIDAQVLATHVLGVNRAYLVANPMRILTETEDARIDSLVALRALGHPVAYLTGSREFYSREFAVSPAVLIPRPETETLVEAVLAHLRHPGAGRGPISGHPGAGRGPISGHPGEGRGRISGHSGEGRGPISVLDLGTGSGAVAITLACERPDAEVVATDTSGEALEVARANAAALGAQVEFLHGSWYAPVAGRRFDVIASNPPYVATADPHLALGDLRFEPRGALTDGSGDGLDSIRAIVDGSASHLNPGGRVLIEHGYDQARAVASLLAAAGFEDIVSMPDLAGIPRVAGGKIPAQTRRNP